MEPGEFLVFLVVVGALLIALLMLTNAYKRRLDFKLRKLEIEARAGAAKPAAREHWNDLLEDRVRVLERIATDRGQDIANQIESLRERRQEEKL